MSNHICPWWLGYFLLNPLRNLLQNPSQILSDHLKQGMWVLDIGCGMGFFSIPMAEAVSENGRVFAIDLQKEMIKPLSKRVEKYGLSQRIEPRVCTINSLEIDDLSGKIDFTLAFAVVHEILDKKRLFNEIYTALKSNGRMFISEPNFHVSQNDFDSSIAIAQNCGFKILRKYPDKFWGRSILLEKAEQQS